MSDFNTRIYPLLPLPETLKSGLTFFNSFPARLEAICAGCSVVSFLCNAPRVAAAFLAAPPILRTAAVVIDKLIEFRLQIERGMVAVDPIDPNDDDPQVFERDNPLALFDVAKMIPLDEEICDVDDRILTQVGAPVKFRDVVFQCEFSVNVSGLAIARQPMLISRELFAFAMSQCKPNSSKEELFDKFQRLSIVATPRKYENVYKDTAELCALALAKRPDFMSSLPNPNLRVLTMIDFIIMVTAVTTTYGFTRFLLKSLRQLFTTSVCCLFHGGPIVGRWVAT